jgi:hypothetical protein
MREEQISLLTEKKQELLTKDNSNTEGLSNETKTENVNNHVSLVETQRNHRMRMLRKSRVRSRR